MKIIAPARDVINALKNAAKFTDNGKGSRILSVIHLVIRDGRLLAEATDRYKVIQVLIGDETTLDGVQGLPEDLTGVSLGMIDPDDVSLVESVLKPSSKSSQSGHTIISISSDSIAFRDGATDDEVSCTRPDVPETYPRVDRLFTTGFGEMTDVSVSLGMIKAAATITDYRVPASRRPTQVLRFRQHAPRPGHDSGARLPVRIDAYTTDTDDRPWARALIIPTKPYPYLVREDF